MALNVRNPNHPNTEHENVQNSNVRNLSPDCIQMVTVRIILKCLPTFSMLVTIWVIILLKSFSFWSNDSIALQPSMYSGWDLVTETFSSSTSRVWNKSSFVWSPLLVIFFLMGRLMTSFLPSTGKSQLPAPRARSYVSILIQWSIERMPPHTRIAQNQQTLSWAWWNLHL